jgi:hypothetical protein
MVKKGEQPAIPLPEKVAKDKYYSHNAVKYIAKVIKNFRYGDFAEYRQGKKCSDKDMVQSDNSKNSENGEKDDG